MRGLCPLTRLVEIVAYMKHASELGKAEHEWLLPHPGISLLLPPLLLSDSNFLDSVGRLILLVGHMSWDDMSLFEEAPRHAASIPSVADLYTDSDESLS